MCNRIRGNYGSVRVGKFGLVRNLQLKLAIKLAFNIRTLRPLINGEARLFISEKISTLDMPVYLF